MSHLEWQWYCFSMGNWDILMKVWEKSEEVCWKRTERRLEKISCFPFSAVQQIFYVAHVFFELNLSKLRLDILNLQQWHTCFRFLGRIKHISEHIWGFLYGKRRNHGNIQSHDGWDQQFQFQWKPRQEKTLLFIFFAWLIHQLQWISPIMSSMVLLCDLMDLSSNQTHIIFFINTEYNM